MENKITQPRLAAMLAIATGKQKKLCEDFLKELFRIVSEELGNGENVRVKGFGTFKLAAVEPRKSVNVATGEEYEIPGHKKVIFVAAKELATAVNYPFEAFEAVEVSDDIPTDVLLETPEEEGPVADEESEPGPVADEESEPGPVADEESAPGPVAGWPAAAGEEASGEEASGPDAWDNGSDDDDEEEEAGGKGRRFVWGFIAGFAAASVAALLYLYLGDGLLGKDGDASPGDSVATVMPAAEESAPAARGVADSLSDTSALPSGKADGDDEVPTRPSDAPVYDTISTTRFLTTMAKEHYGNFNLWPIIYEENKGILGHPDRIKPGTRVVVPSLGKYGVDPLDPDDIARIKQKGIEIYAKYR